MYEGLETKTVLTDNGALVIQYFANGKEASITRYNTDHKIHTDSGPSYILYAESTGCFLSEEYYHNGIIYRRSNYDHNGNKSYDSWWNENKLHREVDPALTVYREGKIFREEWFYDDKRHNINGPALIQYDLDGVIQETFWYIENVKYDSKEINKWLIDNNITWPFNKDIQVLFKLRFC